MPINLNDAVPYRGVTHHSPDRPHYDEDAVSDALARVADKWVPVYFPRGRYSQDRRQIRLANINGDPPKKEGSCVIELFGPSAGYWYDHSLGKGGKPISTLSFALGGIRGADLFAAASELLDRYGGSVAPVVNGKAPAGPERNQLQAQTILSNSYRLAGSPAEAYLKNRVGFIPATDDLRFHPGVTYPHTNQGYPCIVSIWRYPDGNPTGGIHRTYLLPDCSWHLGRSGFEKPKLSLGPSQGGVIMLAPPDADGNLGIGEGIETTLAAMWLYQRPGWAAGTGYMRSFGEWIRAHGPPAGVRRLWVWADKGRDGEASARALFEACREAGLPAALFLPAGPDDFAADLAARADPQPPVDWFEPGEPAALPAPPAAAVTVDQLHKTSDAEQVRAALAQALSGDPDKVRVDRIVASVSRKIGATQMTVRQMVKSIRGEKDAAVDRPWLSKMLLTESGEPRSIMANVATVLSEAEEWKGVFAYNDFSGMVCKRRYAPYEYHAGEPREDKECDEADELETTNWIQQVAGVHAHKHIIFDAVVLVARRNTFNPAREYFDTVAWDGHSRLELLLPYYAGTMDTYYHREVGKRWMIGAVARVFRPGCQMDTALILVGEQGIRKSGFFRVLGEPWFTDQIGELGSKDSAMQMRGNLIVEVAELEAFSKPDVAKLKRVISQRDDTFRPPYGKAVSRNNRQFVFAGTTNEDEFLRDPTGGRRFWPAECFNIPKIVELTRDKQQLWAEAVARYKANEKWWIDREETVLLKAAEGEQEKRYQVDEWENQVSLWLKATTHNFITLGDVFRDCLMITDREKWNRAEQVRIGFILKRQGWRKVHRGGREQGQPRQYARAGTRYQDSDGVWHEV